MTQIARKTHRWLVWLLVEAMIWTTTYPIYAQQSKSEPREAKISSKKPEGSALLQDALRLDEELEWDNAIVKFKEAIAAGLNADDLAEAYWHLALIAYAKDNRKSAEDYILEALRAKPSFILPESAQGTDLEPIFKAAMSRTDRMPPEVRILPPKDIKRNKSIVVVAEVSDQSPLVQVNLSFRLPDAQSDTVIAMKSEKANRWRGEISSAATKTPGEFAFSVSAKDKWQNLATQSGTVVVPLKKGGRGKLYLGGGTIVGIVVAILALIPPPPPSWPTSASPPPPPLE